MFAVVNWRFYTPITMRQNHQVQKSIFYQKYMFYPLILIKFINYRQKFETIENKLDVTPKEALDMLPRFYKRREKDAKIKKRLKQKCKRLQKRVASLEEALLEAQKCNMISQCATDHLKVKILSFRH